MDSKKKPAKSAKEQPLKINASFDKVIKIAMKGKKPTVKEVKPKQ